MNIITGDKFFSLADYICHGIAVESVATPPGICKPHKVMAVEGHNFQFALEHIKRMQHETFILISHNSDANIIDHTGRNFDFHYVESEIPINVKMVFAQNANVLAERLRPIPIGLENWKWHKGFKWKEIDEMTHVNIKRDRWLYINHAIATNPPEREEPYRLFKNKGWATVSEKKSFLEYLTDLKKHMFRICPFGGGLDCHSVWESLHCGCFPIMKRAVFTEMFSKIFPIFLVDDWKEITLEKLRDWKAAYIETRYDEALKFEFWENVIKGKIKIQ